MDVFYSFLLLFFLVIGIFVGLSISILFMMRNEVVISPVFVDDICDTEEETKHKKRKKGYFIRKKKDENILNYRIIIEPSSIGQRNNYTAEELSEILKQQQEKVDSDFEYLSNTTGNTEN